MLYFNAPSEIAQAQISLFSYQYVFESSAFYFLEIRKNNYADGNTGTSYQWFKIKKSNLKITALNLRFVDSSTFVEERFFDEGYLKFNASVGTYIEKYNSAQHSLAPISSVAIPSSVHQAVTNFITH